MKGRAHSDETKAAVMAALLAGQGVSEVARQYHLNESTVRLWRSRIPEGEYAKVYAKKDDEYGELMHTYLREILTTLAVQVRHFRDPRWLEKQSADSLALLHGIACDKAIRLLEAAERAAENEPTP